MMNNQRRNWFTMKPDSIANICVLAGIGLLSAGAWLVHPAAGLAVAGVAAVVVGIGIARNLQ